MAVVVMAVAGFCLLSLVGCGAIFMHNKMRKRSSQLELLTEEQIDQFFNGGCTPVTNQVALHDIPNTAYNSELECNKEEFTIDESGLLGKGEFGAVFRAKLRSGEELDVAAKTVKPPLASTTLMGMLTEIRILGYLGKHENIVSIIGACTSELYKGKVYIFTELCTLGSLGAFLHKIRPISNTFAVFRSTQYVRCGDSGPSNSRTSFPTSSFDEASPEDNDLMKWSYEICCGMEYLTLKRVVHADLATRNVLLTECKTAKISDFGLSRRMYAYERYVKKQEDLLPWRWMPPESLRHLKFNEKTDVWSFGVTLWEIFSYAEVPYGGLSWCSDFIVRLESGLRLGKPQQDHKNLHTLMFQCWNVDANQRPTFSQLKVRLEAYITSDGIEETTL